MDTSRRGFMAITGASALAAEQSRSLPAFIAINAKGAYAMTVEVGKAQSVVVSAGDRLGNESERIHVYTRS